MTGEQEREHWEGVPGASEHRTVGYRAWCHQDGEWCYPRRASTPAMVPDVHTADEAGECSDLLCDCCHVALGYVKAWVKRRPNDEELNRSMRYPTRCRIVDAEGMTLGPWNLGTPLVSVPHIGKEGLAEMVDNDTAVRITLDDGVVLYGSECWWVPL